ncbi:amidohydrolase family protein [Paenibacillus alginolyticus]|uniref:Amidohydrolase family protein n=1 Tax=Paenibacillus alginolyticus TaxID=59839 RepID=A0ABT4GAM8_9BACL|nr:amidohydrolase family protein [Paenibacillus alginolyticus]MCY9693220.1 amidohydrolase family protein [Paenibacillus alginolyticus]MEC0146011.1 amidohydrolase family protein [Paenibacillus alginolyticus]
MINVHTHPIFYEDICEDQERLNFRKEQFGIFKQSPQSLESIITGMDYGGIDKSVLLPEDITTLHGDVVVSNDEIKKLVDLRPDRFIGFASVDPHRADALEVLDYAFRDLGLMGLKLNPSKQKFYPHDEILHPIYKKCMEYNKPIMFHAGMSWEPDAPAKFSVPLNFEEVAITHPEMRICLAHFGWPWVQDTVMLLLKYSNVYTDTSMLYMDNAKDFYEQVFTRNMGPQWIDRNLNDKVMFGSNSPRIRASRLKPALESLPMRRTTLDKIFGANAEKFLGLKG